MIVLAKPLLSFKKRVQELCREALESIGCADVETAIEKSPGEMGDLALPCFPLAKRLKKPPQEIAEQLAAEIKKDELVERIEAKGAYVNFFMNRSRLAKEVLEDVLTEREDYGKLESRNARILMEHTSANPTGPMHVGRARNPIIGDTVAKIMRMAGYDVTTEFYMNDVGRQVVVLSYGVKNIKPEGEPERNKADYRLVLNYQAANREMEEDPAVLDEINGMLYDLEHGDEETIRLVREACEQVLEAIMSTLNEINVTIDQFIWESKFIQERQVEHVIDTLKKSHLCKQEEDGAYALDLSEYGIHGKDTDFVFTRKDGTSLYTTRDLAYHLDKFDRCDIAINVLGEDQKLGQTQLAAALDIMGVDKRPEWIFYAFVSLPEGRMSTRKGQVVYLDDLLDEAVDRAYVEVKKRRGGELSEERMREIARAVGVGAIRFNIVRIQAEKQIVFRWEDALNFEGNSAPFIQYAHARACSILRKASGENIGWREYDPSHLTEKQEEELIKAIGSLPLVVQECGEGRKAHTMAQFAQDLAILFNQLYQFVPVLKADEKRRSARLALVEASRFCLRNALEALGITALEEM